MQIEEITQWFERAVAVPTDRSRGVQIGCHVEEYAEMLEAMGVTALNEHAFANWMKKSGVFKPDAVNRKMLLDSLADQIVTAVGVAHMFGFNLAGALDAVNRANWSKFDENGQPIFDENGKVKKGPNYVQSDLSPFV